MVKKGKKKEVSDSDNNIENKEVSTTQENEKKEITSPDEELEMEEVMEENGSFLEKKMKIVIIKVKRRKKLLEKMENLNLKLLNKSNLSKKKKQKKKMEKK